MRKVSGATNKVVIVGAGLGGLSTALRLAGAGREVTSCCDSSVTSQNAETTPLAVVGIWHEYIADFRFE